MSNENNQSLDKRFPLITRDLQEILGETQLKLLLSDPLYEPVCYFGAAATQKIHLGYMLPMLKIADIMEGGCKVKILIADLHAYLDSMKSSLLQLFARTEYYIEMIKQLLLRLNVDISKVEFVKGTSFQLSKEYTMDVYRANSMVTYSEVRHSGAEVVRQTDNPIMNSLLYPSLQVLDIHYLGADIFLGGIDQRKINTFALELLPKLGYKKGIYLMNPMVPALSKKKSTGGGFSKMSSSENNSKIDILDSTEEVKRKVNQSYCFPGNIKDNTPLAVIEKLIFPILSRLGRKFVINRPEKYGGTIEYSNFEILRDDFTVERLHPADLKMGLVDMIDFIIDPIRTKFQDEELQKILNVAYPNK